MGLGFPCPWIIGKIDIEGLGAELFQFGFGFIVVSFMFLTRIEKKEMRLYSPHDHWIFTIYVLTHAISLTSEAYSFIYKRCNLIEYLLSLICSCN